MENLLRPQNDYDTHLLFKLDDTLRKHYDLDLPGLVELEEEVLDMYTALAKMAEQSEHEGAPSGY